MAKFLILGGNGRLAGKIVQYLTLMNHQHSFFNPSKNCCDITRDKHLKTAMLIEPDIIINCAGLLPPATEHLPQIAKQINAYGAISAARIAKENCIRFIQISTDAVFSGKDGQAPYSEYDEPLPINEYGFSKMIAELVLLSTPSLILRVPFRHRGIWPHTHAFTDAYRSSRWVDEVVPDIIQAALIPTLTGILHMGRPRRSVFEMAREASPDVQPCLLEDFKDFPIPRDTTLDSSKWERIKKEQGVK